MFRPGSCQNHILRRYSQVGTAATGYQLKAGWDFCIPYHIRKGDKIMSVDFSNIKYSMQKNTAPAHPIGLVYHYPEEWQETVLPFLAAGLQANDKCLAVIDDDMIKDIDSYLARNGIDSQTACNSGQLVFVRAPLTFLFENKFDPYQATLFFIEQARNARQEGYASVRFVCEMSCVLPYSANWDLLVQYESLLNKFIFAKYQCSLICMYSAHKFDPVLLDNLAAKSSSHISKRAAR